MLRCRATCHYPLCILTARVNTIKSVTAVLLCAGVSCLCPVIVGLGAVRMFLVLGAAVSEIHICNCNLSPGNLKLTQLLCITEETGNFFV